MMRTGALVVMLCAATAVAQDVRTGFPFLKFGAGAGVGMADAAVASAAGADAMFYNPAGLAGASRAMVLMMHSESIQDVRTEVLGASLPAGRWALGLSLQANTVADVPIRSSASLTPDGTFTAIEGALGIGAAYTVSSSLTVGATVKTIIQKIYTDEALGGAIDLGARYRLSSMPLTLALAVQNLGTMGVLANESTRLPLTVRAGGAWDGAFGDNDAFAYTAAAGIDKTIDDDLVHARAGGELSYDRTVTVRAGLRTGYDASLFTAGLGFAYRFLHFDYALTPYTQSYGTGHTFSLALDL